MDSLYSTSQMPPGVPVATMGIGDPGGKNAGLFAVQILALGDPTLKEALRTQKRQMAEQVLVQDARLGRELEGRLRSE